MIRCLETASLGYFSERTCLSPLPQPPHFPLPVSDTSFLWSEPTFPFSGTLILLAYTPGPSIPHHCPARSGLGGWARPNIPGGLRLLPLFVPLSHRPPSLPHPPHPSSLQLGAFSGQELPGCSLMSKNCLLALFSASQRMLARSGLQGWTGKQQDLQLTAVSCDILAAARL